MVWTLWSAREFSRSKIVAGRARFGLLLRNRSKRSRSVFTLCFHRVEWERGKSFEEEGEAVEMEREGKGAPRLKTNSDRQAAWTRLSPIIPSFILRMREKAE